MIKKFISRLYNLGKIKRFLLLHIFVYLVFIFLNDFLNLKINYLYNFFVCFSLFKIIIYLTIKNKVLEKNKLTEKDYIIILIMNIFLLVYFIARILYDNL